MSEELILLLVTVVLGFLIAFGATRGQQGPGTVGKFFTVWLIASVILLIFGSSFLPE